MTLTMSDFFCGAGGSSTGAVQVPGVEVAIAANHWRLAVDTHQENHPATDHDCVDLSQVDPRRYPTTEIAWFSPECTNHSIAKGARRSSQKHDLFGKNIPAEEAERSRATMWDVIRFAEHHQYRAVIVENVLDVRDWVLWPAWTMALEALGYEWRFVSLNSMFASAFGDPAPQSRNRGYVVAHRKGDPAPDLGRWTRPFGECAEHGRVQAVQAFKNGRSYGLYGPQYVWRCPRVECRNREVFPRVLPAADAIDWSIPAPRIGERLRPLAANTMRRILDGLRTYARPEGRVPSYIVELRGGGSKHRPVTDPLATVCASGNHHGLVVPDLIAPYYSGTLPRPASEPLPTVTTVDRHALIRGGFVSSVDDLGYRMLTPEEYREAMAFPAGYVLLGGRAQRVRLAGNAVTPPAARDLVAAVVESITGEEVKRCQEEETLTR